MQELKWWVEDNINKILMLFGVLVIVVAIIVFFVGKGAEEDSKTTENSAVEDIYKQGTEEDSNKIEYTPTEEEELFGLSDPVNGTGGEPLNSDYTDSVGVAEEGLYIYGYTLFDLDMDKVNKLGYAPVFFDNADKRTQKINHDSDKNVVFVYGTEYYDFNITDTDDLVKKVKDIQQNK